MYVTPLFALFIYLYLRILYYCNIGNTPRQRQRGRGNKQNTSHITSRVIGVEVHCGHVHGTFLYYTDDLTKGGSNTIIEVTRQGNNIDVVIICIRLTCD